jgi:hypothetical protein
MPTHWQMVIIIIGYAPFNGDRKTRQDPHSHMPCHAMRYRINPASLNYNRADVAQVPEQQQQQQLLLLPVSETVV